ncbi:MAG TPA: YmdB family metallophosphoesterase [Epsilonproteobacteria bacterium]|nr:YmdB family metallophosphoesterase [Campylobacterota bacterium]
MTIGFIGDIVGKPGRSIISENLFRLKKEHHIDFVIANYENASHGFGLTQKNCDELFDSGIDVMTGGNHSFDKKEIVTLFDTHNLLRPINYPSVMPGSGIYKGSVHGKKIAVVNLMGYYTMPMVDNPFTTIVPIIDTLVEEGFVHIIVDIHAEATSEKQAILHLLQEKVSAILGTHTHVGTDDLQISNGCCYVTDVGLSGCCDGIIGVDPKTPLDRFLVGIGGHFDIPTKCKRLLQMVVFELDETTGRCLEAKKIKYYDSGDVVISQAWIN